MEKTLVIGIGNIGRADDGLGWAFVDKLKDDERFEIQHRYQLQIEDAELISGYSKVWFVDASHTHYDIGYQSEILEPENQFLYTSHSLHPSAILQLCHDIFRCYPEAHLLGISGDDWELGHEMTPIAHERLKEAFAHFLQTCSQVAEERVDLVTES